MSLALQEIVDGLAVRLSRSVAIDDRGMRLLAVSRHFGDEDSSRVHAVLHREAAAENTSYVLSQGIGLWTGPGRVAARPDLGAAARVCAPVRADGLLLGYLWLIDAQQTLTDDELSLAQEAADEAGRTLHRELMGEDERRAAQSAALLDLVGDDLERRDAARRWIVGRGAVRDSAFSVVLLADVGVRDGHRPAELEVAVSGAADRAGRQLPPGATLAAVEGGRLTLLVTAPRGITQARAMEVGQSLRTALVAAPAVDGQVTVGIGACGDGLEAAATSRQQAADALRAASLLPDLGDVVPWQRLGVYALLLQLAPRDPQDWVLPEPVTRLLGADPGGKLASTLETYLDQAGDAQRAAAALQIHRTTLYYRLRRVEEVTGLGLSKGADRLTLHLGLKLARLTGAPLGGAVAAGAGAAGSPAATPGSARP